MAAIQPFDAVGLRAVLAELNGLGEARIDKVGQADAQTLYLVLRAAGKNHTLLVTTRGRFARLHFTGTRPPNAPVPHGFTMLARKYLEGSRLLGATCLGGLERVAVLGISGRDELGDPFHRELIVELIGKYANMMLVDGRDRTILGLTRVVTESMSGLRQLAPGLPYAPPPLDPAKVSFLEASPERLAGALASDPGDPAGGLLASCSGLSRLLAEQIAGPSGALDRVLAVQAELRADRYAPRREKGARWDYILLPDAGHPPADAPFAVSTLLDAYYGAAEAEEALKGKREAIAGRLATVRKRLDAKRDEWRRDLTKTEKAEEDRLKGELLSSQLYAVKAGDSFAVVQDYTQDPPAERRIPLDPDLTPAENAQRFFKRYAKAKTARRMLTELLEGADAEAAYLAQVAHTIAEAGSLLELAEIEQELAPPPPARAKAPKKGASRAKTPLSEPLRYLAPDGTALYVGRNNHQNERLTFEFARPNDVWLHTQNIPGSHVVIRTEDGAPSTEALHAAAHLAAWHSSARDSVKVPVVYTLRRHVKKPPGAKPGMVIYAQEKTLYVTPDADLLPPQATPDTARR